MPNITAEMVRELFDYDREAGVLLWRHSNKYAAQVKAGGIAGHVTRLGYRRILVSGKKYLAHRLVWLYVTGEWPAGWIDHANGDASDNRFENLRQATPSENSRNKKVRNDNSSGLKGVNWHKKNKRYAAKIEVDGVSAHLGYFKCPTAAHFAYCRAAKEHFGEFARLS
jgi:hypothetical protein